MKIDNPLNLNSANWAGKAPDDKQNNTVASAAQSFAESLKNSINQVNDQVLNADQKMSALASGKSDDIHGTIIALEKADISIKLLSAIRNKVIAAYQEVSRMQI